MGVFPRIPNNCLAFDGFVEGFFNGGTAEHLINLIEFADGGCEFFLALIHKLDAHITIYIFDLNVKQLKLFTFNFVHFREVADTQSNFLQENLKEKETQSESEFTFKEECNKKNNHFKIISIDHFSLHSQP